MECVFTSRSEIVEDTSLLFSSCVNDSHDSLDESVAAFALSPKTLRSPLNKSTELSLSMVVSGVYVFDIDKCKKCGPMLEDVRA